MNLHTEDPRLSAYLLGELPADEAAAVERAVAADPALRANLQELAKLQQVLTDTLAPGPHSLLPSQRDAIRRAARGTAPAANALSLGRRQQPWKPWLAPLAAAAAITLAALLFLPPSGRWRHAAVNHSHAATALQPASSQRTPQLPPAPGPAESATAPTPATPLARPPASAGFPALRTRACVAAATCPTLDLPVQAGDASLGLDPPGHSHRPATPAARRRPP